MRYDKKLEFFLYFVGLFNFDKKKIWLFFLGFLDWNCWGLIYVWLILILGLFLFFDFFCVFLIELRYFEEEWFFFDMCIF